MRFRTPFGNTSRNIPLTRNKGSGIMSLMNKKNAQVTKQLNAINVRMEKLTNKMNKEYNACIQELLSLSTVLQNLEDGFLSTNETLLKK